MGWETSFCPMDGQGKPQAQWIVDASPLLKRSSGEQRLPPTDMESDDNEWQDEYSSFQSQIVTHDMFICIQWEQKLEMPSTFLAHCEDQQANKAHQGQLGAKLQACHDAIEHVWQMKA